MLPSGQPILIIVNGHPATGKTTFATKLSDATGLPLFTKDGFKEHLHEAIKSIDREGSRTLGRASFSLLQHTTEVLLARDQSLIIEANFDPQFSGQWVSGLERRFSPVTVQLFLTSNPDVIMRRYRARSASGERHSVHFEDVAAHELRQRISHPLRPLLISGETLKFDTTDFARSNSQQAIEKVVRTCGLIER